MPGVQVETFETTEVESGAEEKQDCGPEQIALIKKLGLKGQETLITKVEGEPAQVCPYREMTKEEDAVYSELCQEHTKIEEFSCSAIPLRVLQILEHAKSMNFFDSFEIWHVQSQVIKDPVLVAYKKDEKASWRNNKFILARWGQELEALSVLAEKAKVKAKDRLLVLFRKIRAQIEGVLHEIEAGDGSGLVGTADPNYYWRRE